MPKRRTLEDGSLPLGGLSVPAVWQDTGPVDGCVFCGIASGREPADRLYEDRDTVAFMDINPATDGHFLVIPKRHFVDLFDLPADLGEVLWRTVHRLAPVVKGGLNADGLNLVQANGSAAFQTIFHMHIHVVPRYVGDGVRLPWIPRPGDRSRIADSADRIRKALAAS